MRLASVIALCALVGCAPAPSQEVSKSFVSQTAVSQQRPAPLGFAAAPASAPQRSNVELAADFLDLTFRMESGRSLPALSRFDGPITIALRGDVPDTARADLSRLMSRLRVEAGLDVSAATAGQPASITVSFHPRKDMQRIVPTAACFVVPRATTLTEYRSRRSTAFVDWGTLTRREAVSIFVPSDTSPQEVRDCLHEEIAQAMGPLNDLYRLSDSVFNDDNFHTVLTGFDMLMLRVYYAPELSNGMNEAQVASILPGVLARLNPAGQFGGQRPGQIAPRNWNDAVATAFGTKGMGGASRKAGADMMLSIARAQGWSDSRLAFAYFAQGRAHAASDAQIAIAAFSQASRIYRSLPGAEIHAAHVDMQLAALALAAGQPNQALQFVDRALPAVQRAENASLLATLMLMKAEAFDATGRTAEAAALRLDSQPWARYGFGADTNVRARTSEISALAARGKRS